jgi:hypothetical protein
MSRLTITGRSTTWTMNVVGFSSPIYGQINSSQTKGLAVHFPIKYAQPTFQIDVQFANEIEFQAFQAFVRNHQQQVNYNSTALLTLNWPQRGIYNHTGFIPKCQAGGMRANYAPRARIEINLVDSFVSRRTDLASVAANWNSIWGGFGSSGGILAFPSAAEQQQNIISQGQSLINGAFLGFAGGSPTGISDSAIPGVRGPGLGL